MDKFCLFDVSYGIQSYPFAIFADYDRTVIDITGAQMILVMKLSAFGWNIYDGKQPKLSLNEYNKSRAIYKHPNLLPYIGYVFSMLLY